MNVWLLFVCGFQGGNYEQWYKTIYEIWYLIRVTVYNFQREREWKAHGSNSNNLNHKKNREFRRNVTFIANVMLLEAAARNDLAEGIT